MPTPLRLLGSVYKWWWGKALDVCLGSEEKTYYESRTAPRYADTNIPRPSGPVMDRLEENVNE